MREKKGNKTNKGEYLSIYLYYSWLIGVAVLEVSSEEKRAIKGKNFKVRNVLFLLQKGTSQKHLFFMISFSESRKKSYYCYY
jgi:hypothetical protein